MSPQQMREAIRQVYWYSITWSNKVEKMSDKQVAAIYYRMLDAKQLKEEK